MSGLGLTMMLNGAASPDAALPPGQVAEVQYLDLLADPEGTVTTALATFGSRSRPVPARPGSASTSSAPAPGPPGVHRYSLEEFGLDADTIRTDLAPYIDTFAVVAEA